ncbi:unnamed protein product [Cochlearia groenlandica]
MASSISILPLMFVLFATLYRIVDARSYVVGGSHDAWKHAASLATNNSDLDHWSSLTRFQVNDSLVFNFDTKDSVLEVLKENYETCDITKPKQTYKVSGIEVKLNASGRHYFISGSHCPNGQKITIVALSQHHPPPTPTSPPATPTTPANQATPTTTPTISPAAPAPTSEKNAAVGLVATNGIFWAFVVVIGLVWA